MTTIERALITFVAASFGLALAVAAVGAETEDAKILATAYEPIRPGSASHLAGRIQQESAMMQVTHRKAASGSNDATSSLKSRGESIPSRDRFPLT